MHAGSVFTRHTQSLCFFFQILVIVVVDFVTENVMLAVIRVQGFEINKVSCDGKRFIVLLNELEGDERHKTDKHEKKCEKRQKIDEIFSACDELELFGE